MTPLARVPPWGAGILPAMRSPFPGMDPYLERYWGDVHTALCTEIRTELQPQLRPRGLRARATEDVRLLDEAGGTPRPVEPDILVVEVGPAAWQATVVAGVATIEPVFVRELPSAVTARWVEIIDVTEGSRVVTVVEVLSPGNKAAGDLNRRYRQKLKRYVDGSANLVEIDLLRSTRERLAVPMLDLPPDRRAAYCTCVKRAADPDLWEAYPLPLRTPLPVVPVPCRRGEPDVFLALQPIIDRIYNEGAYDTIDYTVPPRPPLSAADAAWAAELIASRPTDA